MAQPSAPGLFGKLPAQGDFFRSNVADPAAQQLIAWLQAAIEPVYRARLRLFDAPVRFVFRGPAAEGALVGVMVASADKVGRIFPLCAFTALPARALATAYPALPGAFRAFLDAAEALLLGASVQDGASLAARARELPVPSDGLADAEERARRAAEDATVPDLVQRLFGDLPAGAAAYALATLEAAAKPVRAREPAQAALALDCPAERDPDLWAWLELARRALRWQAPPPFFWTAGAPGRLVLSLGAPGPSVLVHLCDPAHPGAKIWPLRTLQPAAIETARRTLPAAALRLLDGQGGSVAALVAAAAAER